MANVYDSEDLKKAEGTKTSSSGGIYSSSTSAGSTAYASNTPKTANISGGSSTKPDALSYSDNISEAEKSLYKSSSTQPGRFSFGNSLLTKRKKWLAGGTAAGIVGSGAVFFIFFSGPLQFVHFAQLLQKFHFSNNESFGDGRSSRMIIYSMSGQANRGRLGFVSNKYADKWEARLIKDTGLRPVYTKGTNRFAGFEIDDPGKARAFIADAEREGINTDARDKNVVNRSGKETGRFIDYRGDKFRTKRSAIRTVGKGTQTTKITAAMSSRLLIKRGGVDFHPLKNIKRSAGDSLVTYYQKLKDERAQRDKQGAPAELRGGTEVVGDEDGDGIKDSTSEDEEVKKKSDEIIEGAKKAGSEGAAGKKTMDSLRAGLSKSAGPVVVVGALCTVKSFGQDIEKHQHQIIILPMMRLGFRMIATGNQVMSGQDVNMNELGSIADSLNDPDEDGKGPDTGSSWTQARSIQAELGQPQTGPDLPIEARPSRVGEKPRVVQAVDNVPALGGMCGILSAVSGLPVIKHVSEKAAAGIIFGADTVLRAFDTSVDDLMKSAISLAAGRGVDPFAQGAELGNIANYGARLAANDQALAMGGRKLESNEVALLDAQNKQDTLYENGQRSFARKYLDPYAVDSLAGKALAKAPASFAQLSNNLSTLTGFFSNLFGSLGNLMPKIHAAGPVNYNYGFNEFGFSNDEQLSADYENPFDNALKVEPRLQELNDKYGGCFSMTIQPEEGTDRGIRLINGDTVNYKDLDAKCHDRNNIELTQYRFYIADAVTAFSLDCYEGDDQACQQLGFGTSSQQENTGSASSLSSVNGYKLSATQSKWIKYIADSVKALLPGSSEDQASMAAQVTWWTLKEGVLGKDNLVSYNNCGTGDGNTPIGVTDTCPADTWQVGIAAVQVTNFSLERVESTARERHPGMTIEAILASVAKFGGYAEGSSTYRSIVGSTGNLRKSLLLRDPATGFTLVHGNIQPCITGWNTSWCDGTWDPAKYLAPDKQTAEKVIAELTNYFKVGGTAATGNTQQLAQEMLSNPNITFPYETANGSTKSVVQTLSRGEKAPVTCRNGTQGSITSADINPNILKFLVELGSQTKIGVNALTDKCHSSGSNHYRGLAVDFECRAVSFNITLADPIAAKYGGKRNSETCTNNSHWHYDFTGAI